MLGVGGFNSWRFNQPSLYFFDVATDPARPKYLKAVTPNKGAVADDLIRLPSGGFLVSLMGNKQGAPDSCSVGGAACWVMRLLRGCSASPAGPSWQFHMASYVWQRALVNSVPLCGSCDPLFRCCLLLPARWHVWPRG